MFFNWRRALRSRRVWFSLVTILVLGGLAVLAPWLAPHDPYRYEIGKVNLPPMWVQTNAMHGDPAFPLGTDRYGRDLLSRQLFGLRTAFLLALAAIPLAGIPGALAGLAAGYSDGRTGRVILALTDLVQTLPGIMIVVMVILTLRGVFPPTWGYGLLTLVVAFGVVGWAGLARLVRAQVLLVRAQTFVEASVALGASPWQVIVHHLLPNVRHVILVWVINTVPAVILLEALLGYIGVGVTSAVDGSEFTAVSWGGMFFSGRSALSRNPLMLVIPSVGILLFSMSFVLLGDFLSELSRRSPDAG